MTALAIIGVLAGVATLCFTDYTIKARATDGVMILGELTTRVETDYYDTGGLGTTIPVSTAPSGEAFGGPSYALEAMLGFTHNMHESIEYQPKGPHAVLALRAYRKPEWNNTGIGLHLQIRRNADDSLDFRCTANLNQDHARASFVPSSCLDGDSNDWTSG